MNLKFIGEHWVGDRIRSFSPKIAEQLKIYGLWIDAEEVILEKDFKVLESDVKHDAETIQVAVEHDAKVVESDVQKEYNVTKSEAIQLKEDVLKNIKKY